MVPVHYRIVQFLEQHSSASAYVKAETGVESALFSLSHSGLLWGTSILPTLRNFWELLLMTVSYPAS
jgi:hypothetical protein